MFNLSQAWTIVLRNFYVSKRDFNKLFDFTYWPLMDLIIYGFMGVWFSVGKEPNVVLAFMTAMLLWQVVYRTNLEISRNFLQEIWDNNIINFLTTPLSIPEWLAGLMLTGFLSIFFTVPFGALMIYTMYGYNVFSIGLPLFLFIGLLVISGWVLGLIGSSILIRGGQRVDTVVWALGWLPAPFCSVYYPAEVLPYWAQIIGKCLPMTYAFKAMRSMVITGILPASDILMCLLLNAVYLCAAGLFFYYMFNKSKTNGLSNL